MFLINDHPDVWFQGDRGLKGTQGEKGVKGQDGPPGEQVNGSFGGFFFSLGKV